MGRLAFSLNADGTVTLSCDADRFFAHADEIRRLLAGDGARAPVAAAPLPPAPPVGDAAAAPQAGAAPASRGRRRAPRTGPAATEPATSPSVVPPVALAPVLAAREGAEDPAVEAPRGAGGRSPARRRAGGPGRAAATGAGPTAGAAPHGEGPDLGAELPPPGEVEAAAEQVVDLGAEAPVQVDASAVRAFWTSVFGDGPPRGSRDLSARGTTLVAAASFLARSAPARAVHADDLLAVLRAATGPAAAPIPSATLAHLARRGWLDRAARGAYRTTRRGEDRVASLRDARRRPARARAAPPVSLPRLVGLSRFLRAVPAQRKWRRVLLVCYFLAEHCGVPEVDQRVLQAVFLRLRGIEAPGSLAALLSQTLCKRLGLLEPGSRRGLYRLAAKTRDDLRRQPRVAAADQAQRTQSGSVSRTG